MTRSGHCNPGFKEAPQASACVFEGLASRAGGERVPHTMGRHGHGGRSGALRRVGGTLEGGGAPGISRLGRPDAGRRAHGCRGWATRCRTTILRATSCRSAGIANRAGRGPQAHAHAHGCTPGRTAGRARRRGRALGRPARAGVDRPPHQAAGRERDSTAGMAQADGADWQAASGQDVRAAPAEQRHAVEGGGTGPRTAHGPVGERDRAVRERDKAAGGEGDLADRGGTGGQGGGAGVLGLPMDMPREGPDRGMDGLPQGGVAQSFWEEGAGEGGERLDGAKAVSAGGPPRRAVCCEATARDDGVHVGMIRALPAPGRQDPGQTREGRPEATRVSGEPCEGARRGVAQGVVRAALRRADAGAARLRNSAGAEDGGPGPLGCQVGLEPLRGWMRRTLGTRTIATGMMPAGLFPAAWARREARAVVAALARLDGADDLAVGAGPRGGARQVCWGTDGADRAPGRHGRRPCRRALRRA